MQMQSGRGRGRGVGEGASAGGGGWGPNGLVGNANWPCPLFMLIKEEQNISMYSCLATVGLKASKSLPFTKLN